MHVFPRIGKFFESIAGQKKSIVSLLNKLFNSLLHHMEKYMVKPFPDPENQKETEWLTKEQINSLCLEPSRKWYTAGSGSKGIVRVEVMSCDNLPDLVRFIISFSFPFCYASHLIYTR